MGVASCSHDSLQSYIALGCAIAEVVIETLMVCGVIPSIEFRVSFAAFTLASVSSQGVGVFV